MGIGSQAHATLDVQSQTDIFCSAQILLPGTSQALITGGDSRTYNLPESQGVSDVNIFDSGSNTLGDSFPDQSPVSKMQYERWYPSITTLGNGEIFVWGGIDAKGEPMHTPEIYNAESNQWRQLDAVDPGWTDNGDWWYPRQWLTRVGNIFYLTGNKMGVLDPHGKGEIVQKQNYSLPNTQYTSTAVMYRPNKILQISGGWAEATGEEADPPTPVVTEINIEDESPVITKKAPLHKARYWADAIVLPDGKVLVTGGSGKPNVLENVAYSAELYDPDTNTWAVMAKEESDRLYHSTALLLPDATVITMGGGAPNPRILNFDGQGNSTQKQENNLNAEIYYPPYYFDENDNKRSLSILTNVPKLAEWGQVLNIGLEYNSGDVGSVVLVRTGSVTHSFNFEQRYIPLEFSRVGQDALSVDMPTNIFEAPLGYYMLFVVDNSGVPSQGVIFSLGQAGESYADAGLPPSSAIECALEGQSCSWPSGTVATVWYGARNGWVTMTDVKESIDCTNATFDDPMPGEVKSCLYVITDELNVGLPPSSAVECALEGQSCSWPSGAVATVWYGARNGWATMTDVKESLDCTNATFDDPMPGEVKSCLYVITDELNVGLPPSSAIECALEGQSCSWPSGSVATVWYGARNGWATMTDVTESIDCTNATFDDPMPGEAKSCLYVIPN